MEIQNLTMHDTVPACLRLYIYIHIHTQMQKHMKVGDDILVEKQ